MTNGSFEQAGQPGQQPYPTSQPSAQPVPTSQPSAPQWQPQDQVQNQWQPQAPAPQQPQAPAPQQQWNQPAQPQNQWQTPNQQPWQQQVQEQFAGASAAAQRLDGTLKAKGLSLWPVAGIASALFMLIGSFGTWITVKASIFGSSMERSASGLDGDGKLTLFLALVTGGLLAASMFVPKAQHRFLMCWGAAGSAALATLIALYDLGRMENQLDGLGSLGSSVDVSAGWGLWLLILFGLAATALSVVAALALRPAVAAEKAAGPQQWNQQAQQGWNQQAPAQQWNQQDPTQQTWNQQAPAQQPIQPPQAPQNPWPQG